MVICVSVFCRVGHKNQWTRNRKICGCGLIKETRLEMYVHSSYLVSGLSVQMPMTKRKLKAIP